MDLNDSNIGEEWYCTNEDKEYKVIEYLNRVIEIIIILGIIISSISWIIV